MPAGLWLGWGSTATTLTDTCHRPLVSGSASVATLSTVELGQLVEDGGHARLLRAEGPSPGRPAVLPRKCSCPAITRPLTLLFGR